MSEQYAEGFHANEMGALIHECPYNTATDWRATEWIDGWLDAEAAK